MPRKHKKEYEVVAQVPGRTLAKRRVIFDPSAPPFRQDFTITRHTRPFSGGKDWFQVWKANGPIWEALKRGGRVAYHGYRRRRLEGKLAQARAREEAAFRGNPTGIPGRVLEVRYLRGGKDPGRYTHRYGPNVRFRLGPGRSRVTLYHTRGEPLWADERHHDFDHWVDVDHRRRSMNPRHRLTRKKARLILHHGYIRRGGRKRRLTPQQRKLFGAVASGYHIRRYEGLNPRRRTMRRRRRAPSGGFSTQTWILIGIGVYLWYTGALRPPFVASPASGTFTVPSGAMM